MSGIIVWEDRYSIEVTRIDEQHKKLFEFLNFYYDSIAIGLTKESTKVTLENLIEYASYHFKDEEEVMSSIQGTDFSDHISEHKYFISKVIELQKKLFFGEKITYELFDFMKEWVLNHILISDQKIGQLCKDKNIYR